MNTTNIARMTGDQLATAITDDLFNQIMQLASNMNAHNGSDVGDRLMPAWSALIDCANTIAEHCRTQAPTQHRDWTCPTPKA